MVIKLGKIHTLEHFQELYGRFHIPYLYLNRVTVYRHLKESIMVFPNGRVVLTNDTQWVSVKKHYFKSPLETKLGKALYVE